MSPGASRSWSKRSPRCRPRTLVLDGEAIAFGRDGRPLPFQTIMRRFGRRQKVDALRRELPLEARFFDCLHADGEDAIAAPLTERIALLDACVPDALHMPRLATEDPAAASRFLEAALAAGHEGVMVKDPASAYAAGSRGKAWRKVKPAHTLDLVVLAAEWGHGRRRGKLSNLHVGARDPGTGGFVMLGKTFKGLTDETLAWQTRALLDLEVSRDSYTVLRRAAAGRRDPLQRGADQSPLPGRPRAALRAGQALPHGQVGHGGGHPGHRAEAARAVALSPNGSLCPSGTRHHSAPRNAATGSWRPRSVTAQPCLGCPYRARRSGKLRRRGGFS